MCVAEKLSLKWNLCFLNGSGQCVDKTNIKGEEEELIQKLTQKEELIWRQPMFIGTQLDLQRARMIPPGVGPRFRVEPV